MYNFEGLETLSQRDMKKVYSTLRKIMTNTRSKKSITSKIAQLSKRMSSLNQISLQLLGEVEIGTPPIMLNLSDLKHFDVKHLSKKLKLAPSSNKNDMYNNIVKLGQNLTQIHKIVANHNAFADDDDKEIPPVSIESTNENNNDAIELPPDEPF